jgi:hypothetical protein
MALEGSRLPWPVDLPRDHVDEMLVVVSDIEIGAGGPTEDFPQSAFLGDLLLRYCEPPFDDLRLTVVFNGDSFDLLKTPLSDGSYPIHITEEIALAKLERIIGAHGPFFDRMRKFMRHPGAPRSVVYVVGNHDMELVFEGVQLRLREELGVPERVAFPGLRHRHGLVHVEHGQQHDPLFAVDVDNPFLDWKEGRILNLPWGTLALLEVAMPFLPDLYQIDRLKPKKVVLEALPEVRELLLTAFWKYWTRDFWQRYWSTRDPLRRVTWTMLQEVAYRFSTGDPEVSMQDCRRLLHRRRDDTVLILLGHEHEPAWWNEGARRVLRTGCFRNEYAADLVGSDHQLLPKVYAEVYMNEGAPMRSRLVELESPPAPPESMPVSLSRIIEQVPGLRKAAGTEGVDDQAAARNAQETREANEEGQRNRPGFVETLRHVLDRS